MTMGSNQRIPVWSNKIGFADAKFGVAVATPSLPFRHVDFLFIGNFMAKLKEASLTVKNTDSRHCQNDHKNSVNDIASAGCVLIVSCNVQR